VLVTETFASGLISEGILPTIEHAKRTSAHARRYDYSRCGIVMAISRWTSAQRDCVVDKDRRLDLSDFNDFAPSLLAASLDGVRIAHCPTDMELMRFN